jgi:hypothetical protein
MPYAVAWHRGMRYLLAGSYIGPGEATGLPHSRRQPGGRQNYWRPRGLQVCGRATHPSI